MTPVEKEHIVAGATPSSWQVLRAGGQGAPAAGAGQHRPGPVCAGRRRPGPACPGADRAAGRPRPQPGAVAAGRALADRRPGDRHRRRPRRRPGRRRALSGRPCPRPAWCRWWSAPHGGKLPTDGRPAHLRRHPVGGVRRRPRSPAARPRPPTPGRPGQQGRRGRRAGLDPRVVLLLEECFRHAKAIGAWGTGAQARRRPGLTAGPGVLVQESLDGLVDEVQQALGRHRVWDRDPAPTA